MKRLACQIALLGFLAPWPGWAAGSAAEEEAQLIRSVGSEVQRLYGTCFTLAGQHADAMKAAMMQVLMAPGTDQEKNAAFENVVNEAERQFLDAHEGVFRQIAQDLSRLEQQVLNLPAEQMQQLSMGSLNGVCRAASEAHGVAGLDAFASDIMNYASEMKLLRTSGSANRFAPSGSSAPSSPAAPRSRNVPPPPPLSEEEYKEKQAKWQARLDEQERRAREQLRERQDALAQQQAAREAGVAEQKEVKVALRKDLPPPPPPPKVDPELARKVTAWYPVYTAGVKSFKMMLGQMLSVPANQVRAKREACGNLDKALTPLLAGHALDAPDPAVAGPARAMSTKFSQAALACLGGNQKEADRLIKEAEQELGKMAASLQGYGLTP